jgi:hypothetical protein
LEKENMADTFNWKCPYCGHNSVIEQGKTYSVFRHEFYMDNRHGYQAVRGEVVICPNKQCREYSLTVSLHDNKQLKGEWVDIEPKRIWHLCPESIAKPYPDYIPAQLLKDYNEACLILEKSPKASATLSRRCLQGMIRDFWGTQKARLVDEIDAIKDKVDPDTWSAIDSLRKVGNIGAHMEKDINLIIDVEPAEAELLVGLIETLFDEWYIARHERQQRMGKIKQLAQAKDSQKTNPQPPT